MKVSVVSIDTIEIPEDRQRREFSGIEDLADSLKRIGLINPITLEGTRLIAGHRRLLAAKHLGWTEIPANQLSDLDELRRTLIELEENVKRHQLTWQEEADAIAKYHRLMREVNSAKAAEVEADTEGKAADWTLDKTAEALGVSRDTVRRAELIHDNIEDPKVKAATSIRQAASIIERRHHRRRENELARLLSDDDDEHSHLDGVAQVADFTEWVKTYKGSRFSFIHCDFPYGIGHTESAQGNSALWDSYQDDSPELFKRLLDTFLTNQDRFIYETAHCMFWFSFKHFRYIEDRFREAGWTPIFSAPLIWHKTDNRGILSDPTRAPRNVGEYAMVFQRGDRRLVEARSNIHGVPSNKQHHGSEKPVSMLRYFLKMFIDETTEVFDPTCGAGGALRIAAEFKASRILGLDIEPKNVETANQLLNNDARLRGALGD